MIATEQKRTVERRRKAKKPAPPKNEEEVTIIVMDPKDRPTRTTYTLPVWQHERLKEVAQEQGLNGPSTALQRCLDSAFIAYEVEKRTGKSLAEYLKQLEEELAAVRAELAAAKKGKR